ncbi:cytochrome P450 [Streptomyces sp. NPDC049585]|uniref:cytochrome P450 n=1 Tax=Streptomyces sp. NPDC049585 TaxID=3155154 RepID=UPI003444C07E
MPGRARTLSLLSLFGPEWGTDPYPLYRTLLEQGPVHWDRWMRSWLVLGHEEITRLSRDERLTGARIEAFHEQLPASAKSEMSVLKDVLSRMMLFNEPPEHTRLRRLIKPGLTPRFIHDMRPLIEERADALLDRALTGGTLDVIHDYSEPLTREVVARLAGVPGHGMPLLENWQGLLLEFYTQSARQVPRIRALRELFDEGARARREGSGADLFSRLITDQLRGGQYTDDEVFANFLLLIDAGQATTTHLIGNAVLALLRHPDQLHLLRDKPELAANAAHEFLRYDSSVQFTSRVALADIELAGHRIAAGDSVALVLGAGNRDPRRYTDPERLDVTRRASDHLSFGHGIHYCLGAALALAETEIAVARLLARTADLCLTEEPVWIENVNFRFLSRLPVLCTPLA